MPNPDDTVVCPYNMAHSIVASRIQFHLRKCRLQHPDAVKAVCPNNSTHIVNKVELDFHLQWCKDRITFDKMVCKVGTESPYVKQPTYMPDAPKTTSTNEEWGEEVIYGGESILEKVKEVSLNKPALHNKICAPKSERKAHKLAERQRFQQVLDTTVKTSTTDLPRPVQKLEKFAHDENKNAENLKQVVANDCEKSGSDSDGPGVPEAAPVGCFKDKEGTSQLGSNQPANYNGGRDPKNPWGSARTVATSSFGEIVENAKEESRNSFIAQKPKDENRNNLSKSDKPSSQAWGGWSVPATNTTENVSNSFQKLNINDQRDPGNPWKLKNIAANFDGPVNNDFPILPMSGKGRGRRMPK
uniref:Unkown protein n=1 Tax=Riptortus pedestris TaxID=329032 RepID=R4WSL8_RIPPE|nr:unkown protein [Riptortus pedestris]